MDIIIKEELRAYIDPLTEDELAALEQSILNDGCRDPLVLWENILIDGHNRYSICQKHHLPFNTIQHTKFTSIDDVHLWMIDNHLGRRSVSDFQRGVLALRKKEILAGHHAAESQAKESSSESEENASSQTAHQEDNAHAVHALHLNREELARAAKVSSATLGKIEKIQKEAAPELVNAVKSGMISISAAAEVASLPSDKQVAAVNGGKKELRQAAKEVRESKLPPKPILEALPEDATTEQKEIHQLKMKVAELSEERDQLKKKVQHLTIALKEARGE